MPRRDSFDERLLHWIDDHRVDALTTITTGLMDASETRWLVWTIAFLGVLVVAYKRAWRVGLAVGAAFYAGANVASVLKDRIERSRPAFPEALVQLGDYAMPSSHAAFTMAMTIALLLAVTWRSRRTFVLAAVGLGLGVLLVGLAMVYLDVHWATDVLAGWALGAAIGAASGLVFRPRASSV